MSACQVGVRVMMNLVTICNNTHTVPICGAESEVALTGMDLEINQKKTKGTQEMGTDVLWMEKV